MSRHIPFRPRNPWQPWPVPGIVPPPIQTTFGSCPRCAFDAYRANEGVANDRLILATVLDSSGSMAIVKDATINGFNSFLSAQKESGINYRTFFYAFDSGTAGELRLNKMSKGTSIKKISPINAMSYRPEYGGGTPLHDAVCETIHDIDEQNRPTRVLLAIITDGEENMSHYHDLGIMRGMIERRQALGWMVTYIGANVNAYAEANKYGIAYQNTLQYNCTPRGMSAMTANFTQSANAWGASGGTIGSLYTPQQQSETENTK